MLEPSNMGLEAMDTVVDIGYTPQPWQPWAVVIEKMMINQWIQGLALSENYRFTAPFRGQSSCSPTKTSGKMCFINFHQ
jgi:hypothetical protein